MVVLGPDTNIVGIMQSSIPGFQNSEGLDPTQVTIAFADNTARAAKCDIAGSDASLMRIYLTKTTISKAYTFAGDSYLAGFQCLLASKDEGPYSVDVTISSTVGVLDYIAKTTLTAEGGQ